MKMEVKNVMSLMRAYAELTNDYKNGDSFIDYSADTIKLCLDVASERVRKDLRDEMIECLLQRLDDEDIKGLEVELDKVWDDWTYEDLYKLADEKDVRDALLYESFFNNWDFKDTIFEHEAVKLLESYGFENVSIDDVSNPLYGYLQSYNW
ncbi:MAG: hypothetical protein CL489_10365 [Acidobacteria bacterium]|nr:hypothetical protein [Acidobacteriota bacterium]